MKKDHVSKFSIKRIKIAIQMYENVAIKFSSILASQTTNNTTLHYNVWSSKFQDNWNDFIWQLRAEGFIYHSTCINTPQKRPRIAEIDKIKKMQKTGKLIENSVVNQYNFSFKCLGSNFFYIIAALEHYTSYFFNITHKF